MVLGGGSREGPEQSHSPHRTGHKIRGENLDQKQGSKGVLWIRIRSNWHNFAGSGSDLFVQNNLWKVIIENLPVNK